MMKRFAVALFAVCLLVSIIMSADAYALDPLTTYSIAEKDLFHHYAASSNPAAPCANFTSADLPATSRFDTKSGLFSWLPDYGSAGSYTVTFGCADDPANPGTQQIKINVTPVTPVYIQSSTPKVTLVAAVNPSTPEQDNDQKSLAVMLGVYGLTVEKVEDLGMAFATNSVGRILVVPSYMAKNLTPATIQQVVSHVKGGGSILLFGRSPLSEALGISYNGGTRSVTEFVDYLNPKLFLIWAGGEPVEAFTAGGSDTVLAVDKQTLNPLVIGRQNDGGRILYVGTNYYDHFSVYGTKGHPYLLYHFMDNFRLQSRVSATSIDAYFDPGNYDLSKVYIEDIVRTWADRGITTVYAAAWHFWINEQSGQEWTFGYDHFIKVCHLWGIKAYAWFALPHVSQKYWYTKPECREKTAGTGEKYAFWRLNVNLQNPACLSSALQSVDDVMNSYDWDGLNLAEIYYDYEKAIEYFTPMNNDLRQIYAAISGFDPIEFFNISSSHYYLKDTVAWAQFLQYRTDLVTALHKTVLDSIFNNPKILERDVILTAVDSLHYDYPDLKFPTGYEGTLETGVDLPGIIKLLNIHDFQLQVEDPWPFWSSNPFRYQDFKKTYLEMFPIFKANDNNIMFDVNIFNGSHSPSGGPIPIPSFDYPANIQTGLEFSLLLKNMIVDSRRIGLFSENTVEFVDFDRLKWALAGDTVINQPGANTVSFIAKRTTKLEANPAFYSTYLDGKMWPAWSAVDSSVLLPVGSHQLTFRTDQVYNGIKLSAISCALEDAGTIPGGISVNYNSPRQKAVLTVEAFSRKDNEPFRVLVDGSVYNATIYPFYGYYRLFLPKGKHSVQISVVSELSTAKVYLGADDSFTVSTSGTTLYGGAGNDSVTISAGMASVILDQNVERINFSGTSTAYAFKQTGNKINVYDATGVTLLVTIPVQGDSDGTLLSFSNGIASARLSTGVITLGGATVSSAAATTLTLTTTASTPSLSTATKAKVFLGSNDNFTVNNSGATIYGGAGNDAVTISSGMAGIILDQNVERLNFSGTLKSYAFKQTGNKINVYDAAGTTLLVTVPVQGDSDGTVLSFSDGSASALLTDGVMTLGGVAVSSGAAKVM